NNQHPTTNIQQPTSNNQQPTSNIQQPTTNIQHPTSNERLRSFALGRWMFSRSGLSGLFRSIWPFRIGDVLAVHELFDLPDDILTLGRDILFFDWIGGEIV